jgi:NAD+ synthase
MVIMIKLPTMNPVVVSRQIQKFILNTVEQHKKTGVVLGLSGGIDSSVVAVLCKRALEGTCHNVVGYFLPHVLADKSRDYVNMLVDEFEILTQEISIEDLARRQKNLMEQYLGLLTDFDKGNLYSRVRANVLSTLAAKENKVLSGTGNRDEDYGIGYYTLFGDGAVHMNPIGCLSKRLVYQMANYLEIPTPIIGRPPSAGLEPDQTDFKDLGYTYETVEIVIEAIDQGVNIVGLLKYFEEKRIVYDPIKFQNVGDVIGDIISRNLVAKSKAQIVHPPVPEVTLDYIELES